MCQHSTDGTGARAQGPDDITILHGEAMVTVWNAGQDLVSELREGRLFLVTRLIPSEFGTPYSLDDKTIRK